MRLRLGRASLILVVLVVGNATSTETLCLQIPDLPFKVVGYDLDEAPYCVAPESPRSSQTSAMAEPPALPVSLFFPDRFSMDSAMGSTSGDEGGGGDVLDTAMDADTDASTSHAAEEPEDPPVTPESSGHG